MKSSNLFWGFFFITFGALYLIARYTSFAIDWYAIWDLWPVIIILAGVAIILKGTFVKYIYKRSYGNCHCITSIWIFNDMFDAFDGNHFDRRYSRDISENYYKLDYDKNINHVNLKIEAGAGKFEIEKTTDNLVKGYSRGNIGNYNFTSNNSDSVQWVNISMDDIDNDFFNTSFKNDFRLQLNDNPTWSFDINIGAAKSYFNLIPFKVENLVLNTGAANTKIKLGNKSDRTFVNVKMGAAALKIYIPRTSGCKINGDMVLMSKDLKGFSKQGSDYLTENFETSNKKIIMDIEGGMASFEVERY